MHGDNFTFFGFIATTVVRGGGEVKKRGVVYWAEKHRQICMSYNVLPDPLEMSFDDIDYWYDGIKGDLIKHSQ